MIKQGVLALFLSVSATVASAQSIVCNLNSTGEGFIPEVIGMRFDADGKRAVVYDAYIDWAKGGPITAKVRQLANGKTEVSWPLTLPTRPMQVRVTYRVILAADKKSATMRGTMRNADNSPSGNGTCAAQDF